MCGLYQKNTEAFEIASTGHCFCILEDGKIGLYYPQVKAGDQVWVLKNSNSPFMLRKVDSESIDARLYKFGGDCYLDGAMDEEAIKAMKEGSYITLV